MSKLVAAYGATSCPCHFTIPAVWAWRWYAAVEWRIRTLDASIGGLGGLSFLRRRLCKRCPRGIVVLMLTSMGLIRVLIWVNWAAAA